ncbi:MAG: hypothetical protein K2Y37_13410 [Pirellulales bacterium]|nr:hypothetical protein [Pirellulales bacterium]
MSQPLLDNPWLTLAAIVAAVIVACVAIVFVTDYLRQTRQAEIDAALKRDMLSRGMSAADIKTILEATSDGEAARMALHQRVSVGLGKFRVEVGTPQHPVSGTESSAVHG